MTSLTPILGMANSADGDENPVYFHFFCSVSQNLS